MIFNDVKRLNKAGVFALVYPQGKVVYVGYGVSMLQSLKRLLDGCRTNRPLTAMLDNDGVELVILGTLQKPTQSRLRLETSNHTKLYKAQGYAIVSPDVGLRLKVNMYLMGRLVAVELVSSSKVRTIVGLFKRVAEADEFVLRYYAGDITTIVYSRNRETTRYRQGLLTNDRKYATIPE